MDVFEVFFFFKQKTAYELRISDWSSDVCSSDLSVDGWLLVDDDRRADLGVLVQLGPQGLAEVGHVIEVGDVAVVDPLHHLVRAVALLTEDVLEEVLERDAVEVEDVRPGAGRGRLRIGFLLRRVRLGRPRPRRTPARPRARGQG